MKWHFAEEYFLRNKIISSGNIICVRQEVGGFVEANDSSGKLSRILCRSDLGMDDIFRMLEYADSISKTSSQVCIGAGMNGVDRVNDIPHLNLLRGKLYIVANVQGASIELNDISKGSSRSCHRIDFLLWINL